MQGLSFFLHSLLALPRLDTGGDLLAELARIVGREDRYGLCWIAWPQTQDQGPAIAQPEALADREALFTADPLPESAVSSGESHRLPDIQLPDQESALKEAAEAGDLRSELAVPIPGSEPTPVLVVWSVTPSAFAGRERAFFEALAELAGAILRHGDTDTLEPAARRLFRAYQAWLESPHGASHGDAPETATEPANECTEPALAVLERAVALGSEKLPSHEERVAHYVTAIARKLGWSEPAVATLGDAARIHEAGKIGLTSDILLKPYPGLSQQARERFHQHPIMGEDLLSQHQGHPELAPLVRAQHEYWNGSGFPDGLSGRSIFESARVLGVAGDFDDVLLGNFFLRPLRPRKAMELLLDKRDGLYGPVSVDALLAVWGEEGDLTARDPFADRVSRAGNTPDPNRQPEKAQPGPGSPNGGSSGSGAGDGGGRGAQGPRRRTVSGAVHPAPQAMGAASMPPGRPLRWWATGDRRRRQPVP